MINDEMAGEEESSASSVPQVDEVVDGGEDDEEEFEITGEGTASTGQGLKKIFFVKQKNPSSASDEEKVPPQSRMKGMFKKFTDSAATEMKRLKNVNLPIMNLNLDLGLRRPGSAAALYYQGEKVSARFLGADWRLGVVARVRGEGEAKGSGGASYDVLFAHGALEVCIPPARLSKQLNLKEEVNEAIEESGGGGQEGDPPPPPTVTATNNWADLPPADPREFEIFWDPAEGPLFFELAAYKTGGGVVATKVDLRDPRVQATRLDGGARLTAVTAAAATEGGGGDEDAGAAGGAEEAGAAGGGRTAAAAAEFKLEELKTQIAAASKPMGFRFREGPPVYRAERVAAARAAARRRPPLHVATFLPQRRAAATALDSSDSATPKGAKPLVFNFGFGAGTANVEYEDIFEVSQRAMDFLESFHEHGILTELVNIETVTLPEPRNQGGGGGGLLLGGGGGGRLVPAARLWWRFPEATTVAVARTEEETAAQAPFGLVPHRTGEDGGFLCCRASPGSAMARAGVPVDRTLLLTHVNGYDVCPIAYRSIAPKQDSSGINSWAETVVPLFMECKNECTVTFI